MPDVIITIAAVVAAAAAASGAAYTIVATEDAKAAQKKAQDDARKQFNLQNNQDPVQQLAVQFKEAQNQANIAKAQLVKQQADTAAYAEKQKQVLVISLVIGGGATLYLLTKKK